MKECTSHDPDHPLGNVTYTRVTRRRRSRQPPVSAGERSRGQTDRLGPEWSEAGVSKSRERAGERFRGFPQAYTQFRSSRRIWKRLTTFR